MGWPAGAVAVMGVTLAATPHVDGAASGDREEERSIITEQESYPFVGAWGELHSDGTSRVIRIEQTTDVPVVILDFEMDEGQEGWHSKTGGVRVIPEEDGYRIHYVWFSYTLDPELWGLEGPARNGRKWPLWANGAYLTLKWRNSSPDVMTQVGCGLMTGQMGIDWLWVRAPDQSVGAGGSCGDVGDELAGSLMPVSVPASLCGVWAAGTGTNDARALWIEWPSGETPRIWLSSDHLDYPETTASVRVEQDGDCVQVWYDVLRWEVDISDGPVSTLERSCQIEWTSKDPDRLTLWCDNGPDRSEMTATQYRRIHVRR